MAPMSIVVVALLSVAAAIRTAEVAALQLQYTNDTNATVDVETTAASEAAESSSNETELTQPVAALQPQKTNDTNATVDVATTAASEAAESSSNETELTQPVREDNPSQDPRVGSNIKHFRQGPFNEGDRPIDIYCVLMQHALEDSLEDKLAEKNVLTTINIASFVTIGQLKLASTGNVSCKAVYKVPRPEDKEQDPYVEVEFATKGLNISSAAVTAHIASARKWFGWDQKALDATVDLGFTMDIDFGVKINTVRYNVEVTKFKVANLEPRSSSKESTSSSIAALAVKMGVAVERVTVKLVPDCVTTYVSEVITRIGNYVGTRLIDPETGCKTLKHAILPMAMTDLDFSSVEPVNILGKMLKFRAEHVKIPPSFVCQNFSFNGRRLIMELEDVEVNAQMFLESLISVEDGDGNVEQTVDANSSINVIASLHLVQSISLDLDVLEPQNTIIMPSNVTVDIQVPDSRYQQMFANFAATVSQFSMNQFGWVTSSLAAWILEKELKKDLPMLEQKGGAAPAFSELTTSIGFVAGLHDVWNSVWNWASAAPRKICDNIGGCVNQVQQWSAYRPSLM